jgi:hypothetical protein
MQLVHRFFTRYIVRVLTHTLTDWKPRLWSVMLTIASLTIATLLQPPPPGTINLDWTKWKATVEAWAIVLVGLLLVKVICAQWKVHKEDQEQLEMLQQTQLTIHSADFYGSDGKSQACVKDQLQKRKRDGLVFVSSSDGFGVDPALGDEHKYLKLSYSFGSEGPFDVFRPQTPYRLVLPQDKFLLEQKARLRRTIEETHGAFRAIEQAGKLETVRFMGNRLHLILDGLWASLKGEYPNPFDHQALMEKPNDKLSILQALYEEYWQQTSSAASGLSFDSTLRKTTNHADKTWKEASAMLAENNTQLEVHAARLWAEANAKATISEIDQT